MSEPLYAVPKEEDIDAAPLTELADSLHASITERARSASPPLVGKGKVQSSAGGWGQYAEKGNEEDEGRKGAGAGDDDDDEISDSELLEELEREEDGSHGFDYIQFREARLEQLKTEMSRVRDMRESSHGVLSEITNEKEVMNVTAKEKFCVVHFYHRDFTRCKIMDKHLEQIAPRHFKTRFIKVFVESVPWLVERLGIKVLPCVICFVDGATKDRIVGFEDVGNTDNFTTSSLELRLSQSGVIQPPQRASTQKPIMGFGRAAIADDDDDIWDD